MTTGLSWESLLRSEDQKGDRRWACLVPGPEAEIEDEARELGENPPPGGAYVMVVRGEWCRDSEGLFREFDRAWEPFWGAPDHSGQNWDGFGESLHEVIEREREGGTDFSWMEGMPDAVLVLITRSGELLRDDPEWPLATLVDCLRIAACGLAWEEKDRPRLGELRVVFQCETGEAEAWREHLLEAGLDL